VRFDFLVAALAVLLLGLFSGKKSLPLWSLISILSFLTLILARFQASQFFVATILAASGWYFFLFIVYSFEHPMLTDVRDEINKWFRWSFNAWIRLPLPVHRHIVIGYSALLTFFSFPNGVNAAAKK
jgi:hypothetical protein